MEKHPSATPKLVDAPGTTQDASFLDTKASFDAWLDILKPPVDRAASQHPNVADAPADFVVEFGPGSNCRIVFTGLLEVSGSLSGSLRSDSGSLITHPGKIDADIDVAGKAIIDSIVNGNINATGRVVLGSNAKVIGNISASALSVKRGATFEGDCVFVGGLEDEVQPARDAVEAVGFYSAGAAGD